MTPYNKIVLTVMITAAVTAGILSPMVSMPGKSVSAPFGSDCSSAVNQIGTLEQYGHVNIGYYSTTSHRYPSWWSASFATRPEVGTYSAVVDFRTEQRGTSMCEAVDKLYYKVMEFPLPKSNWRR